MWERAKASRNAYLLELTFGKSCHVLPCRFCANEISLPSLAFWSTHAWNCWHTSTLRACSENLALSFAWKRSGWVMAKVDLVFTEGPWPSERSNTTELLCLFRQNWTLVRSACPPHSPVMWPVWWSSSSGSCRSRCWPQSCRKPFSRPSSSPQRRTGCLPPCCCPVCCQTETWPPCVTFLTSSTTCALPILASKTYNCY